MSDERHSQLAALDELLQNVQETNAFQRARLSGARVRTLDDLRALPFTTKHELLLNQAATPPYGTNLTFPLERYTHLHLTSGTVGEQLRVLQTADDWLTTRRCFAFVLRERGSRRLIVWRCRFRSAPICSSGPQPPASRTSVRSRCRSAASRAVNDSAQSLNLRRRRSSAPRHTPSP